VYFGNHRSGAEKTFQITREYNLISFWFRKYLSNTMHTLRISMRPLGVTLMQASLNRQRVLRATRARGGPNEKGRFPGLGDADRTPACYIFQP
jgi:hypothetical protein